MDVIYDKWYQSRTLSMPSGGICMSVLEVRVSLVEGLHHTSLSLFSMAVALVFVALLLAMAGHSSATWCICKDGSDAVLQKTLDYACGAGADCNPTHQGAPCFNPNTVRAHCSYAVNSYFQKNRQQPTACDFSGTATIVTSDPSTAGCMYPASASATTTTPGTSTTPTTTVSGTPTTTVPGGSPMVNTPTTGVLGGANSGLGPSGMNTDMSKGGHRLPTSILLFSSMILTLSSTLLFW
ncbi:plasmodesmata callose-binding protein 2 [Sesamum alatum]|uniref:Plasmodesmata callose-binding protein 2 n=1 Tax=Sesamum alatum TaxID=300844 RepID=A0AAE1YD00_9LAMI|nr:plasmodesmata callose-binding protein 2 [Sesamum alatum]